jgi:pimeloyl-ACP methyl ester carboxylesterase
MRKQVILLHGALGSKNQLKNLEKELQPHCEVFTFNFEGHGGSSTEKAFSIDLFTENLSHFINENKLQLPVVFGYSMGGYVALHYAAKQVDGIGKIITYGTKFNWSPESALKETNRLLPEKMEEKIPQFAAALAIDHGQNKWKEVVIKTATLMQSLGNAPVLNDANFPQISSPTLICWGDKDTMVSLEESLKTKEKIPNAQFLVLNNFVHPLEQNDLKKLAQVICDF